MYKIVAPHFLRYSLRRKRYIPLVINNLRYRTTPYYLKVVHKSFKPSLILHADHSNETFTCRLPA